ncbi:hypothetical protein GS497_25690 [Rhodococcus hoagii]|nr:hypothetical protein [Prescottella equi]
MLGATVMPHAIYVHSALARDRHGAAGHGPRLHRLFGHAMGRHGGTRRGSGVNIGMLLLAASALRGVPGTDSIEGAHAAIQASLGPGIAVVFPVGLLASGLASTSWGAPPGPRSCTAC